jgi:hypothetical protein
LKQESTNKSKLKRFGLRRLPIVMLYVASMVNGTVHCFTQNPNVLWTIALCMGVSAIHWVQLDARHRGRPIPRIALQLLLMLWTLFVPIYLISTRWFRGFGWVILNIIGLNVMSLISCFATQLLIHGPQFFQA